MTPGKSDWRLDTSGVGATNDAGFWVAVHQRTGSLELQFGSDDNAQLPLDVLCSLFGKAGLRVVPHTPGYDDLPTWEELQDVRTWIMVGCPAAYRDIDPRVMAQRLWKLKEGLPKHGPIYAWGPDERKA